MWEPRHPSLKVVLISVVSAAQVIIIFKKMMTTLNSRLLVSQSRSGGRFQVGFGVLCWSETHQQLSGATHTRLFGWFHFTGVLLLQGVLRFASEQQNPENNF